MIKKTIKTLFVLLLVAVVAVVVLGASFYYNWWKNGDPNGKVHISIDGVTEVFKDLTENQGDYDSAFDNEMLAFLKSCHDTYGAQFTLYCYYEADGFSLTEVPDTYREELSQNADWLKFGFYYATDLSPVADVLPEQLGSHYTAFATEIVRITGAVATTVRMPDWGISQEAVAALEERGVESLMTVSDEKAGYYFGKDMNDVVMEKDTYRDDAVGMTYIATDLCLGEGRINAVYGNLIRTALNEKQYSVIAVSALESEFGEEMAEKIENVCEFTDNYDYEYTLFEKEAE